MKNLILLSIVLFSFASCKKDYCVQLTDQVGDECCIKCFRNKEKALDFYRKYAGADYCQLCK
jgi:hypothetical protein